MIDNWNGYIIPDREISVLNSTKIPEKSEKSEFFVRGPEFQFLKIKILDPPRRILIFQGFWYFLAHTFPDRELIFPL